MQIIPQKDPKGQNVPGQYLVVVSSPFGAAVLYGPASFTECAQFIRNKIQELEVSLDAQIKEEHAKSTPEPKRERSSGMGFGR